MNKYLAMVLVASLGLVSCSFQDEKYFLSHPKELHMALKSCPTQQPQGLSCDQLQHLAARLNQLAYQLQSSPQGFGTKILVLQELIAQEMHELKGKNETPELRASLEQNQHELADYLAVVKWLESPES
jgi:hypothetical protein